MDRFRKVSSFALRVIAAAAVFGVALSSTPTARAEEDGFDAASIASFIDNVIAGKDSFGITQEQYSRRNFLYQLANDFRIAGAIDINRLIDTYAPGNPAALAGLLDSKASKQAPGIWRYFFRQSLIYAGRVDAPVSRIGFYNPIVDGWVMTDWEWSEQSIRLIGAHVAAGETVTGVGLQDDLRIGWTRSSDMPLVARLRGATSLAGLAFAGANPVTSTEPPAPYGATGADVRSRVRLEARLLGVLANLNVHYRDADKIFVSTALIDAMKIGDKAALTPIAGGVSTQSLHAIAGLPGTLRRNLELVGSFPTPSGTMMVFGMPMMSRWMVIARYTAPADGAKGSFDGLAAFEITPSAPTNRETTNAGL